MACSPTLRCLFAAALWRDSLLGAKRSRCVSQPRLQWSYTVQHGQGLPGTSQNHYTLGFEFAVSHCMFTSLLLVSEVTASYTLKPKDLGKIHKKKEYAALVFLSLGWLTQFLIRSFTCEFEDFVFLPSCVCANLHYQLIRWRKCRCFHSLAMVNRATANMAEQVSGVRYLLLRAYIKEWYSWVTRNMYFLLLENSPSWFPQWLPVCKLSNYECSHMLASICPQWFSCHCQFFATSLSVTWPYMGSHPAVSETLVFTMRGDCITGWNSNRRWDSIRLLGKMNYLRPTPDSSIVFHLGLSAPRWCGVAETSNVKTWRKCCTQTQILTKDSALQPHGFCLSKLTAGSD